LQTFASRQEAIDFGKDYEYLVAAYFALILSLNDKIAEFRISTNNKNFGDFDDAVIEIELVNGEEHVVVVQLKHVARPIAQVTLVTKNKRFGLKKYGQEFNTIKASHPKFDCCGTPFKNFHFVLYTNSTLEKFEEIDENWKKLEPVANDRRIESDILIKKCYHSLGRRLGLYDDNNDFIYKFKSEEQDSPDQQFFQQFVFYTQQKNAKEVESSIAKLILNNFPKCDPSAVTSYMNFFSYWCRGDFGHIKLTKQDVRLKLAELLLTTCIPEPCTDNLKYPCDDKIEILSKIFANFDVVLVKDESETVLNKIWAALLQPFQDISSRWTNPISGVYQKRYFQQNKYFQQNTRQMPIAAQSEVFNETTLKKLYLTLWHSNLKPLLLKIDEFDANVWKMLELTRNKEEIKNCIIFSRKSLPSDCDWKTFTSLDDLLSCEDIYQKVTEQLSVSLQGRPRISLKQFLASDATLPEIISFKEIMLMLDDSFVLDSDDRKIFPKHYVTRFVPKILINIDALKEVDDLFVVVCADNTEIIKMKLEGVNTVDLNKYLLLDRSRNMNMRVPKPLFSSSRRSQDKNVDKFVIVIDTCTTDQFEQICSMNEDKNCHYVRLVDDGKVEWIRSGGSIDNIRPYQLNYNYSPDNFVRDQEMLSYFDNKLNILCAGPGMGKSVLVDTLKLSCPSSYWVVTVNLNEHVKFLKENHTVDETIEYFLTSQSNDGFIKQIVKSFYLKKKILFLWDSFDEMSHTYAETIITIIKTLATNGHWQWIFSRESLKDCLESAFNTLALTLTKFSQDDQYNYVYSTLKEENENEEEVKQIVHKVNDGITKSLRCGYLDYSGVPLQIHMMVEIFKRNLAEPSELQLVSLTDTYEEFIEGKFDYLFKKADADLENYDMQEFRDQFRNRMLPQYESAALKALFDEEVLSNLHLDCDSLLEELSESEDILGLIVGVRSDKKPVFIHKSYQEFLAALWLSRNYHNHRNLILLLFKRDYSNTRLMFDMLLAKNSSVHLAVLYRNLDILEEHEDEIVDCRDAAGRSVLHLACSWGRRHPLVKTITSSTEIGVYQRVYKHTSFNSFKKILPDYDFFQEVEIDENPFYPAIPGEIFIVGETVNCIEEEDESFLKMLLFLLEHKCNPLDQDKLLNWSAFQYADESLCLAALNQLVKYDHISLNSLQIFNHIPTILSYSTVFFYNNLVELIDDIPYVEYQFESGRSTLLQVAVEGDNLPYVSRLLTLQHYQDVVNKQSRFAGNPLSSATATGNLDMINLLLEKGARPNGHKTSPLVVASYNGNKICCEKLIEVGANVNEMTIEGLRPLVAAILTNQLDIALLLLQSGADVNCSYKDLTALDHAVGQNQLNLVQLLLRYKPDINHRCKDLGYKALHYACEVDDVDIIKCLLQHGADPTIKSKRHLTPLHVALSNGKKQAAIELIKADPSVVNDYSLDDNDQPALTPMCLAAMEDFPEVIKLLAECGADVCTSTNGIPPLHFSGSQGLDSCLLALVNAGAAIDQVSEDGVTALVCSVDNISAVRILLDNGADVNFRNRSGLTALHHAVVHDKLETVQELVEREADVNIKDDRGKTALYYSILRKNSSIAKFLLKRSSTIEDGAELLCQAAKLDLPECVSLILDCGVEVNSLDSRNKTALHYASTKSERGVKVLLERGGDPNSPGKFGRVSSVTPLMSSLLFGRTDILKILLDSGANPEHIFGSLSALHVATVFGDIFSTILVADNGADVNILAENGRAPLHYAAENDITLLYLLHECSTDPYFLEHFFSMHKSKSSKFQINYNNLDCAKELISRGANPNQKDNNSATPLHLASSQKFSELIKLLVNNGANVNSLNSNNQTPLHLSCEVEAMDDAEFLIKSGARLDLVDEFGKTPTEYALGKVHKGGFENGGVLKKLQKLGADLDLPDDDGFRLLHKASKAGDSDVVSYLLNSEVDVDSETREGLPPIFYAVYGNHKEIVLQLLEHSCKVNVQDSSGNTLLHIAVANGCQEIVKYLLKAGCNVNDQNNSGNTVLHLAAKSGSYGSCKILLEAGANQDILNCEGTTKISGFLRFTITFVLDASPLELVNPEENKDLVHLFRSIKSLDSNYGLSKN
jgi:ankyrin repeat protein